MKELQNYVFKIDINLFFFQKNSATKINNRDFYRIT